MAKVVYDSELMTQQIAATPVPPSKRFVAFSDEKGSPVELGRGSLAMGINSYGGGPRGLYKKNHSLGSAPQLIITLSTTSNFSHYTVIVSIGSNGTLYAVKEDESNSRMLVDLSAAVGISESPVVAFDCVFNKYTSQIHLCFAYDVGEHTELTVLKPFGAEILNDASGLKDLIIPFKGNMKTNISRIFVTPNDSRSGYPDIVFAHIPVNSVHGSSDLARVQRHAQLDGYHFSHETRLPENASSLVDFRPAVLPFVGSGYFALYITRSLRMFPTITDEDRPYKFRVSLKAPQSATCLSTLIDKDGHSILLVGGAGDLTYWKPEDALHRRHEGTLVPLDSPLSDINQLHTTQIGDFFSLWVTSAGTRVSYANATNSTFAKPLQVVPVLETGGLFAPFYLPRPSFPGQFLQQLLVANEFGHFTLLSQHPDTSSSGGLSESTWKVTPFNIPALDEVLEFNGYMTRVQVLSANGKPLPRTTLSLMSSTATELIVNGRTTRVWESGTSVITDMTGTVTLVIPTADISSSTFRLGNPKGKTTLAHEFEIDPTNKVHARLSNIQRGDDLKNATLQSGGKLLDGKKIDNKKLDHAAAAIDAMCRERGNVATRRRVKMGLDDPKAFKPGRLHLPADLGRIMGGSNLAPWSADGSGGLNAKEVLGDFGGDIVDAGWDLWNSVKDKFNDFKDWWMEIGEEGLKLLVWLGNRIYRFALHSIEAIAKGISFVIDKVLGLIDKLVDWLGFIFNWGDILETHDSVITLINTGLKFAPEVQQQMHSTLGSPAVTYEADLPNEFSQAQASPDPEIAQDPKSQEVQNSSAANNMQYQFAHGGSSNMSLLGSSRVVSRAKGPSFLAEGLPEVTDAFEQVKDVLSSIGDAFMDMFENGNSMGVGELIKNFGEAIFNAILGALRTFAAKLADSGTFNGLMDLINLPIHIPIFSALYKKFISKGRDLTILSGFALILAIPATIVHKILIGKKAPKITQSIANTIFTLPDLQASTLAGKISSKILPSDIDLKVTDGLAVKAAESARADIANTGTVLDALYATAKFLEFVFVGIEFFEYITDIPLGFDSVPIDLDDFPYRRSAKKPKQLHPELVKFLTPTPLQKRSTLAARDADYLKEGPFMAFERFVSMAKVMLAFPRNNTGPAAGSRYLSWVLMFAKELLEIGIATQIPPGDLEPGWDLLLVSIKGIMAVAQFVLHMKINKKELDHSYEDRDPDLSAIRIVESLFIFLSGICSTGYGLRENLGICKFPFTPFIPNERG
ncbi:uncharacterized protein Z519_04642 [Cladophialophora bantiana CBS 173.52]|uniref:Uncharacterized protein n=1 Tax=Cladophialophora bantiana (strain ATCC 10958 / CBS 173.52 / CDC B-1940 / NIH 8579) TaxID=1442370 RepID=A0A0D2HUX0_CLAB1|nr:uncharacterized protein Z519_04642 [Cladophialophora bantiana CBS 173.52]KIW94665.1 hypothetical protein Z519_04642 [Cladophialophora bantiana CBS 173.52]